MEIYILYCIVYNFILTFILPPDYGSFVGLQRFAVWLTVVLSNARLDLVTTFNSDIVHDYFQFYEVFAMFNV